MMKDHQKLALQYFCGFTLLFFANGCIDAERSALLDVKTLLIDPSNRLDSWQDDDCCIWKGIGCSSSGNVVSLDLRNPNPESFSVNLNSELIPASSTVYRSTAIRVSMTLILQHYHQDAMFDDFITNQLANLTSLIELDLSCSTEITDSSNNSVSLTSSSRITYGSLRSYIPNGNLYSPNLNWLLGLTNLEVVRLTGVDLSVAL
ncbi:hypothetical protein AgCh_024767 [Apium graveolens]